MARVELVEGKCILCGCTEEKACVDPHGGACWWVDATHLICSHHPMGQIKKAVEIVKDARPKGRG